MAEIFVWHPLSPFIYVTLSATHCFSLLTPCSSSAIPEGPKSFLVSSRAVWWRTTRSAPRRSSSWSTPSSETNPTRGKSAFSSKTTSTVPRRRGEKRVRMSLCLSLFCLISQKTWKPSNLCSSEVLELRVILISYADETEYEYSGSEEEEEDPPEQEGEPRYGPLDTALKSVYLKSLLYLN